MATPYSIIYDLFKDRIVRDSKFYIKNDNQELVNEVANRRIFKLLNQSIYYMYVYNDNDKRDFQVDFYDKDDELLLFNIDLKEVECQLLADVMFDRYINEETIVKMNALRNIGFKDDELVQFSPANTLKEFNNTISLLNDKTNGSIMAYKKRDRDSRKYKGFNYDFK